MDELYARVSSTTKQVLYQFMKDQNISLLNYHFEYYFQFCIQENNIQVLPHHFSNHKIEGLTVVDELGTSFSYERDNPKVKQNFTLCHELGHFILQHDGSYFAESVDNQEDILEREANIFSAIVLMPDIVLLSKVYYSCDTFQQVHDSLEVSKKACCFRLLDLLREHFPNRGNEIKNAIDSYITGSNSSILLLFHEIKEQIIEEFNQYQPSFASQIEKKVREVDFITSQEFPELIHQKNWDLIKESSPDLKIWLIYNKGKTVAYVWNSKKLSDSEARKKAELQLLLM
ncbi:ImmA/IrrE family metallo-endopeptidase [Streptococcus gordonii]|uniref:ImmA/IrrE family metallo-endopeptidase n=1 Tax=Streptococcus gordonii TaxID=1302 RepID=UPI000DA2FA4B|nr:ImmA/IrrE family metallo-endopeptidase [Streptococcus gordonii]QXA19245.1 ImmA/IrrE family metallo-endopeptidase [Streptococcus gordonii]SQG04718.1 putative transcriptional regulator [Streptococcus gordonii]